MGYRYAVVGTGRQGVAAAYDLAVNGEAKHITLYDENPTLAVEAADRLLAMTGKNIFSVDEWNGESLGGGFNVVLNAATYKISQELTRQAVTRGFSLCDLGGNTPVVIGQCAAHAAAIEAGVTIAPDCGVAPGALNTLAMHQMSRVELPRDVTIYCGGLPVDRKVNGSVGYHFPFSGEGLLNEYSGKCKVIDEYRVAEVDALSRWHPVELNGESFEAFATHGGSSLQATGLTHNSKLSVRNFAYYTMRYSGHWHYLKDLQRDDMLDWVIEDAKKRTVRCPDRIVAKITVRGMTGEIAELTLDDRSDDNFSAMERCTGFSVATVMHMIAKGEVHQGVVLPHEVPAKEFSEQFLEKRLATS